MINHISYSQITSFMACPLRYRFGWIDKLRAPIGIKMVKGKSVHRSYESNFKFKKDTQIDMKIGDLKDIYSTEFERTLKDEEVEDRGKAGEEKDEGIQAVELYYPVANTIIPDLVEASFEIDFQPKIHGRIDLATTSGVIRDYKVSRILKTPEDLKYDLQYLIYSVGYFSIAKKRPSNFIFDYIRILKKKSEVRPVEIGVPGKADIDVVTKIINKIVSQMEYSYKTGNYFPNYSPMNCSWCGFKDKCREGNW